MRHLTLGEVIKVLSQVDPTRQVAFDFAYTCPTTIASYRGYYDQPALGWGDFGRHGNAQQPTVAALLTELRGAIGKTFEGWKGGDYTYGPDHPLWVDNPGDCSSTFISDVDINSYYDVVLVTGRQR